VVQAKILDVDIEKERISLGIKQVKSDPVEAGEFRKGQRLTAEVVEITSAASRSGSARTTPSAPSSANPTCRANAPSSAPERFAIGDRVDALVTAFDRSSRKVLAVAESAGNGRREGSHRQVSAPRIPAPRWATSWAPPCARKTRNRPAAATAADGWGGGRGGAPASPLLSCFSSIFLDARLAPLFDFSGDGPVCGAGRDAEIRARGAAAAKADGKSVEIERMVDIVLEEIAAALERGDRVEIRGFGAFSVRCAMPASAAIRAPAPPLAWKPAVPFFKAGKELRTHVTDGEGDADDYQETRAGER